MTAESTMKITKIGTPQKLPAIRYVQVQQIGTCINTYELSKSCHFVQSASTKDKAGPTTKCKEV